MFCYIFVDLQNLGNGRHRSLFPIRCCRKKRYKKSLYVYTFSFKESKVFAFKCKTLMHSFHLKSYACSNFLFKMFSCVNLTMITDKFLWQVPDFDIVTYTVAMPTDMVGNIRRNLELSHHSFSSSASKTPHHEPRQRSRQVYESPFFIYIIINLFFSSIRKLNTFSSLLYWVEESDCVPDYCLLIELLLVLLIMLHTCILETFKCNFWRKWWFIFWRVRWSGKCFYAWIW